MYWKVSDALEEINYEYVLSIDTIDADSIKIPLDVQKKIQILISIDATAIDREIGYYIEIVLFPVYVRSKKRQIQTYYRISILLTRTQSNPNLPLGIFTTLA